MKSTSNPRRLLRWSVNGVCLLATLAVTALFLVNRVNVRWPPIQCSGSEIIVEPRLSHVSHGDTVSVAILVVVILLLPVLQILWVELYLNRLGSARDRTRASSSRAAWAKNSLVYTLKWVGDYLLGLLFTLLVLDIGKSTVNAPRPHFLDSCDPVFESSHCIRGWVEEYTCKNPYNLGFIDLNDLHKSFPSGHSGLAMYSAVFIVLYLHHSLDMKRLGSAVLVLLHTAWIGWGFFCGLSRLMDNRHHPIDVVVGFLIGGTGALLAVTVVSRKFQDRHTQAKDIQRQAMTNGGQSGRDRESVHYEPGSDVEMGATELRPYAYVV